MHMTHERARMDKSGVTHIHHFFMPRAAHALSCLWRKATSHPDTTKLPLPNESVDYIFTDPPFGENIYYADLNFMVEAWYRVISNAETEAIVDKAKKKALSGFLFCSY